MRGGGYSGFRVHSPSSPRRGLIRVDERQWPRHQRLIYVQDPPPKARILDDAPVKRDLLRDEGTDELQDGRFELLIGVAAAN